MAISQYYVDPAAGSDTTGNGTIGAPWKSVQYALNTVTRNATDGDQINVKAGAADVLTAALSLVAYGTPSGAAPLLVRGYTSAAGDGGIGEIDGAGSYSIYNAGNNSNKSFVHFWDMKLGNCGASQITRLQANSSLINCEMHTSSANQAVYFHNVNNRVVYCLFHGLSGSSHVSAVSSSLTIIGSAFHATSGTRIIDLAGPGHAVIGCYFDISADTSLTAVYSTADPLILHCTVYSSVAQTVSAFQVDPSSGVALTLNNLVAGYSGAGGGGYTGAGALTVVGGNAYHNNTTNETVTSKVAYQFQPPVALASAPFVDAANDDFNLAAGSAALGAAWPPVAKGLPATTSAGDVGAAQSAGSGGGGPVVGSRIIRGVGAL